MTLVSGCIQVGQLIVASLNVFQRLAYVRLSEEKIDREDLGQTYSDNEDVDLSASRNILNLVNSVPDALHEPTMANELAGKLADFGKSLIEDVELR